MSKKRVRVELRVGEESELSKAVVVRDRNALICTRPVMFHFFADDFLKAAEGSQMTGDFAPVPCFLYCKSIELSLKSFLLAKNVDGTKVRRNIGHNLERALEEAESQGLYDIVEIPCEYKEELRKANYYYKDKAFEYLDSYEVMMKRVDLPSNSVLSKLASMLVAELGRVCFEAVHTLAEKSGE